MISFMIKWPPSIMFFYIINELIKTLTCSNYVAGSTLHWWLLLLYVVGWCKFGSWLLFMSLLFLWIFLLKFYGFWQVGNCLSCTDESTHCPNFEWRRVNHPSRQFAATASLVFLVFVNLRMKGVKLVKSFSLNLFSLQLLLC